MKTYSSFCSHFPIEFSHRSRKYLRWSFCLIALQCLPAIISRGCGPVDYGFHGYSFLLPDLMPQDAPYAPFVLRFDQLVNAYQEKEQIQINENLAEWQEIFCALVPVKAIGEVIYDSSVDQLSLMKTAVNSKNIPLDFRMKKNAFARHLERHQCNETIDYLIYAKKCEPHVSRRDAWDNTPRDVVRMKNLIAEGRRIFRKLKSNYIRLRYAYQMIRLAHYSGDYEQTLELYEELLPKVEPIESILHNWILGHKAGALYRLGEKVEAAYLFSLIFQHSVSKRESAFQSFRIGSDDDWQACLLRCQSDAERATLHVLRALEKDSQVAEEMEKIYALDPTNENMELLLGREIANLEKDFLGLDFNNKKKENRKYHQIPRKNADALLIRLQKIVRKCVEDKLVSRPTLWQLAEGYLEFLASDHYAAAKTFRTVEEKTSDPILKEQLAIFQLAFQISSLNKIGPEEEEQVVEIIKDNPHYQSQKDFRDYLNDKLYQAYANNGHPGKSFRCQYNLQDLKPNPQAHIIDDLLTICQKDSLTRFERALTSNSDGQSMENDLLDMRGNLLFSQDKLEAALESFKQIPRTEWDKYQFNPFVDQIVDCIHCPLPDTIEYFNKVEIIEKIFELEYQSKADFRNSARYFYQLGTAFYNLSYFGHSWNAFDYFRSGTNWEHRKLGIFDHWFFPYGNREHHDCTKALFYFDKARELAKDPELAARATFMAAKCEQNNYFVSKDCDYSYYSRQMPQLPLGYQKNYQRLKNNYADTRFYQEAVTKCRYFAAFASK